MAYLRFQATQNTGVDVSQAGKGRVVHVDPWLNCESMERVCCITTSTGLAHRWHSLEHVFVILVTGAAGSAPYPHDTQPSLTVPASATHTASTHRHPASPAINLPQPTYPYCSTHPALTRSPPALTRPAPIGGGVERHHPLPSSPTLVIPSRNASPALEAYVSVAPERI